MSYKGSRDRTTDKPAYDASPLWANIDAKEAIEANVKERLKNKYNTVSGLLEQIEYYSGLPSEHFKYNALELTIEVRPIDKSIGDIKRALRGAKDRLPAIIAIEIIKGKDNENKS